VGGTRMPWCAAAVEGMRTWSTPSGLLRLLEQASLILRECLSGQALVPSGGTLLRLCQHAVGGLQSPHAASAVWVVCNLLSSRESAGVLPVGRNMP